MKSKFQNFSVKTNVHSEFKKGVFLFLIMSVLSVSVSAQKGNNEVRAGNKKYNDKKYIEAEIDYRKGLEKNPKSFEGNYNLGNSLFRQKKYEEAYQQYEKAASYAPKTEKEKLAATYHNMGNSLLMQKKIEESIEAYKQALRHNPKDNDTRYNLAYAQSLLKKQQQQQNKNDKNQDQKQDQKQDNQQNKQNDNQKDQKNQQQQQQQQMTKENAQQILDALSQDEKETMNKAKKLPPKQERKPDKDW